MPSQTADPASVAGDVLQALAETRTRTLALVDHLDDAALERVHSTLMSPLVWDLGHIAAFEDLWIAHRVGGMPLLRPDLADVYDAFETPRADRGELPYLRRVEAGAYLDAVRERTLAVGERAVGAEAATLFELVLRHEQQHTETMLQTMQLARLAAPPGAGAPGAGGARGLSGLELVEIPAGPCTLGAPADGFAYDNERPRHAIELPAFRI
jgi:iron(II)-dependent oxidoreductase